jgi:hypothetical protein
MIENSGEMKRKIIEEWRNSFPELSIFANNKLYKVVGPLVLGIELIKLPRTEEYRPHFVIYGLWEKDIKSCLDAPIMLKEFYNRKGLQYSIPYEKHGNYFYEVVESAKNLTAGLFGGNISLKNIISQLDEYSNSKPLSAAPNSYLQALLQGSKLQTALYIGDDEAGKIFESIKNRKWDLNHFKLWGVDISNWIQELRKKIDNRESFLEIIRENKIDKKIQLLKGSELVN